MQRIENKTYDAERAFYGANEIQLVRCAFDGPADGESAFKESAGVVAEDCFFNLRYPFWHVNHLRILGGEMTALCRAALWYTTDADIRGTKLHGIKALRECTQVHLSDCDIVSPEFGWFSKDITMKNCRAESEYFMLRARNLQMEQLHFKGKYSFQYVEDAVLCDCVLDTKDAFWHAKNVTVRNCTVRGEYLGWYCENVTFDHCKISGTQPLCYCKNLKLIDCEMEGADFAFEKSEVEATLTAPVISIKNPAAGTITLPAVGEIIRDDEAALGKVCLI